MKGRKIDFYYSNLKTKLKLFVKSPSFIAFYISRFFKYTNTKQFDVFIISYPKSGRTWLQKLLIEAVALQSGLDTNEVDVSKLSELIPNFPKMLSTHAGSSWEEVVKDENEILKDDLNAYKHGKIIYLYRDPRDVLVSQFYHITKRSGYKNFSKDFLITNTNVGIKKIVNFMNKWRSYSKVSELDFIELSYEELKKDTYSSLSSIFNFIDFKIDSANILKAIELCSIDKMKDNESANNSPWLVTNSKGDVNNFLTRKGLIGEHKVFFKKEDLDLINSDIEKRLDQSYNY